MIAPAAWRVKYADVIIVDSNPLKDLESMRRVTFTIANGVAYDWSVMPQYLDISDGYLLPAPQSVNCGAGGFWVRG